MPESYVIKVHYKNGKTKEITTLSHAVLATAPICSIFTAEKKYVWIPTDSFNLIEFDKDFTEIIEVKNKDNA